MKKICYIMPLSISIILTCVLALSTHVLILQNFNSPTLNIDPKLNQIIGFIVRFTTVIGAVLIYFLSRTFWDKIKPVYRVILFALLIMALTESLFRSPIMEIVAGVPWTYQVISVIPSYASWLTLSLFVCIFMLIIKRKNKFIVLQCIVFSILTTVVMFFIKKLTNDFITPLLSLMPQIDMSKLIHPPYGMNVMIPAYITFLEPTIGSFILFYLIRNRLSAFNTLIKGLIIGSLLIIIHGGIYSMVQIACSEGDILYRIFYYGQFLWEYLALGVLTAYSVAISENSAKICMVTGKD